MASNTLKCLGFFRMKTLQIFRLQNVKEKLIRLHLCSNVFRKRRSGYRGSPLLQGEVNVGKAAQSSFVSRKLKEAEDVLHGTDRVFDHLLLSRDNWMMSDID